MHPSEFEALKNLPKPSDLIRLPAAHLCDLPIMLISRLTGNGRVTSLGSMNIRDYEADDKPALEELTLRAWKPVFADLERSIKPEIYEVFVPDWQAEQMRSLNTVCDSGDSYNRCRAG